MASMRSSALAESKCRACARPRATIAWRSAGDRLATCASAAPARDAVSASPMPTRPSTSSTSTSAAAAAPVTPATTALADPVGDPLTDPIGEVTADDVVTEEPPASVDVGGGAPGEAISDSAEEAHDATTPDAPAEIIDIDDVPRHK